MAEIIKTNGERVTVQPKNGKGFKLEELKKKGDVLLCGCDEVK